MELKDLQLLLDGGKVTECMKAVETHCVVKTITAAVKQLDPKGHDVMDPVKRPNRYATDAHGNIIGDPVLLNRIPLALQKKIVTTAAAFLGSPAIQATPNGATETLFLTAFKKVWDDCKLDYKFRDIAKTRMSIRHCAELWYTKEDRSFWEDTGVKGNYRWRMRILSPLKGDKLYPVFDEFEDMVAFGRGYDVMDVSGAEVEHFDIYTADKIYMMKKSGSNWMFDGGDGIYSEGVKFIPNELKKIPVVYYHQPAVEWEDVQPLIERLEEILSNHADTNDYVGSPIVFAEGAIEGFAKKGQTGKVLQGKNGAKVSYLTYDSQPASVDMEIKNLIKFIFMLTHTPEISMEEMKSLGQWSGVALKMLFMDAHIKAAGHEESFGECVQRRINLIKAALVLTDAKLKVASALNITPKFTFFLPQDVAGDLANIVTAKNNGLLSTESSVKINPLVEDSEAELTAIQNEQQDKVEKDIEKQTKLAQINKPQPPTAP